MNFELTDEQRDIQRAAREFAEGEFDRDLAMEFEKEHAFPKPIWKKACELGFVGIHFPEAYGGQGLGILENTLIVESFCRQDSGIGGTGIAWSRSDDQAVGCKYRPGVADTPERQNGSILQDVLF